MRKNIIVRRKTRPIKAEPPFCWQNKDLLRKLREKVKRKMLPSVLAVYLALTELSSNYETSVLKTFRFNIAEYSGLSERTVSKCLRILEECDLIELDPQERNSLGRFDKQTITLLSANVLPKESSKKVQRKSGSQSSDIKKNLIEEPKVENIRIDSLNKNLGEKVQAIARLKAQEEKIGLEDAEKFVLRDLSVLGEEGWLKTFRFQEQGLGLKFYNHVSYSVRQKDYTLEEAIKEWDDRYS